MSFWHNKKVLVTGGAGFIGGHLCEELENRGALVTSLDDYSTGTSENHVENVNYVFGKTTDIESLIDSTFHYVFHLGEYSRVEQSFEDITKVWESNSLGTLQVLRFCSQRGSRLVYAGSSTKFGDDGSNAYASPYAWTKFNNTALIKHFADWFGLRYSIAYFYNAYGPREISTGKYATLIARFSQMRAQGLPLTVVKPGSQRRNFTHVKDIVSGLLLVGQYGEGDGYGIGNDISYSIMDVAKMFGGELTFIPERKGNRMSAGVETSKIKSLGWQPQYNLEQYIDDIKSTGLTRD